MPSPASSESTIVASEEGLRFRAASLDQAVAAAEQSVGGKVKVLEANKIRRGGIGGFFASDLGVEVTVVPEEGSVDDVLERLVAGTTDQLTLDAALFGTADLASLVATSDLATSDLATTDLATSDLATADMTADADDDDDEYVFDTAEVSMRELRKMVDLTATVAPHAAKRARATGSAAPKPATAAEAIAAGVLDAAPRACRKLQPPAEMVSVKDIVAELAALTAHRSTIVEIVDPPTPVVHAAPAASLPAAKKRLRSPAPTSAPVVTPAADASAADVPVDAIRHAVTPVVAAPVAAPVTAVAPLSAIAPVSAIAQVSATAPVPATAATGAPVLEVHTEIVTCNDDGTTPVTVVSSSPELLPIPTVVAGERARPAGPPSRSHIELTLAAADQLIDSLSRTANVRRLSVRVALRAGDQREVEVEAQWEATAPVISAAPASAATI